VDTWVVVLAAPPCVQTGQLLLGCWHFSGRPIIVGGASMMKDNDKEPSPHLHVFGFVVSCGGKPLRSRGR